MTVYELWLPILLAGLATHVISTICWTALPHHKPEWNRLPVEDEFIGLLETGNVPPNQYIVPHAAHGQQAGSEEYLTKAARCSAMVVVWEAPLRMGPAILKTLIYFFAAAFCIGYLASLGVPRGAEFGRVLQFVTTAALLTHCFAHFPHVFWFRRRIGLELVDGAAQAIATGLIFAALWPAA